MAQPKSKKVFAAESMRRVGKSTTLAGADDAAAARHDEILAAIGELRQVMGPLGPRGAGGAPAGAAASQSPGKAGPVDEGHMPDVGNLKHELQSVRDAILNTKKEIAAVRHPASASDRLLVATDELDAVVAATEQATQTILQSVENLDEMAERIKQSSTDDFVSKTADEMRELIIKIFEACNFQDITGQRITKVVTTVKFIEERVNAMISIWGPDSFAEIDVPDTPHKDPDHDLLSGPQLGDKGVSQEDIDKLFG